MQEWRDALWDKFFTELRRLEIADKVYPSGFAASAATSPYAVICFGKACLPSQASILLQDA
jgi:hypothetical protein